MPANVISGSAGVFFPRHFVGGQQRFQHCEACLDLRDVYLQLGHRLPDLVITLAHVLRPSGSSSPNSADNAASWPATSCRWAIACSATARIWAGAMAFLGLARAAASSALTWP